MPASKRDLKKAADVINLRAGTTAVKALASLGDFKTKIAKAARNAVAVILKTSANERYFYGEGDNLPNAIIATVDNSGTATACIERLEQFIQADGFIAEGLDEVKANSKQTLIGVLSELVTNVAYLEGFALRLIFDNEGKIKKIYNVDIKTLRKKGGGFEFNPLNGEIGKVETETQLLKEFDPDKDAATRRKEIAEQVEKYDRQVGEILYVFRKGLGRYYDVYPVPRYYASIEDLVSDGKISRLDLRNISQGFRTPVVISTGPIDDQNEDEHGKTPQDYFDESLEDFTGEDASPILHLKGSTEEFKPTVTVINLAEILDQTDRASERIAKRVARIMGVPDVLIGIAKEGQLGNVNELKNQLALFALSNFKRQELIKGGFDLIAPFLALGGLAPGSDFTISTLKPFDFIPDAVIAGLSTEEQKELFEIELEVGALDDQAIASRFAEFGVGGVQGILGIQGAVSVKTITLEAGAKVLEVLYGFSKADAYEMLGGATDPNGLPLPGAAPLQAEERNDALANLTGRQLQGIQRIVRKFNKDELSYDQAAQLLIGGFSFTELQVDSWLVTKEEEI